jgi:NTP pyrophosphatase (non-canonical NTP hydrolase)
VGGTSLFQSKAPSITRLNDGYQIKQVTMTDLTVKGYQEMIDGWIRTTGVRYFSELTNLGILMEETGEVARIMTRMFGEQSFKDQDKGPNLADELADVLFVVGCIANQTGIDLTEAISRNMEKKSSRDSIRHRNNPKLTGKQGT